VELERFFYACQRRSRKTVKRILKEEKMHHITLAMAESAEASARWNNNMQAFVEALDFVPVSTSSDPRHTPEVKNTEFTMGAFCRPGLRTWEWLQHSHQS
jgi:hypothetical protein